MVVTKKWWFTHGRIHQKSPKKTKFKIQKNLRFELSPNKNPSERAENLSRWKAFPFHEKHVAHWDLLYFRLVTDDALVVASRSGGDILIDAGKRRFVERKGRNGDFQNNIRTFNLDRGIKHSPYQKKHMFS